MNIWSFATSLRHLGIIAQLCRAISPQLKHVSTNGKKHVKHQYLLHMSSQYGELRPTSGWDRLVSLGHPSKFQRVSRLGSIMQDTLLVGVSRTAALNRGRYLYLAGWPSRWALADISSLFFFLLLWSPYVIGRPYIFLPCSFFPSSFFFYFARLISEAVDRMSAILLHMAWP